MGASALVSRYRVCGERSEKVDAALQHLALPSLGQWRDVLKETLDYLVNRPDAETWEQAILDQVGTEHRGLHELFTTLAGAAGYAGRIPGRPTALDLIDLLPTYRNAMLDAHGSVKADPARSLGRDFKARVSLSSMA